LIGGIFWDREIVEFFAEEWRGCEDVGAECAKGDRAARSGGATRDVEIVKWLLGAERPECPAGARVAPLHDAGRQRNAPLVELLLTHGAIADAKRMMARLVGHWRGRGHRKC